MPEPAPAPNGDYTTFATHYDQIMRSGYYDYEGIAGQLAAHLGAAGADTVLEIGVGTGLIVEQLLALHPQVHVDGVDLTEAMLDVARDRLAPHLGHRVTLHRQNVLDLDLPRRYRAAFSYGGVWYFVPDGGSTWSLISHLREDADNEQAIERLGAHVVPGGTLLLGVQAPHSDYARPVPDDGADGDHRQDLQYAQRIEPLPGGFRKHYTLTQQTDRATDRPGPDTTRTLMEQTTDYAVHAWQDALALLAKGGFELDAPGDRDAAPLFLSFTRR